MGADKAQVRVQGIRLIDAMLSSLPANTTPIVVSPFSLGVPTVSEEPPFGGPVAGIAAGLAHASTDLVAVLAVDAPHSADALPLLLNALATAPEGTAAAVGVADDGFMQPLCAVWRRDALAAALTAVGTRDVAAKALYRVAPIVEVATGGAERDYDTPEALAELGQVEL